MSSRSVNRKGNVHVRGGKVVLVADHRTTVHTTTTSQQERTRRGPQIGGVEESMFLSKEQAEEFAASALREHGLHDQGWVFVWSTSKTKFGTCNFPRHIITLSEPLAKVNTADEVQDTILHEVAHALAGPAARHGSEWKAMAIRVGARPEARASENARSADSKWTGTCPNCGDTVSRHRLTAATRKTACADCCNNFNKGKFTTKYQWLWEENTQV